jgi:hypothetical protein
MVVASNLDGVSNAIEASPSETSLRSLDAVNLFLAGALSGFGPYVALFLAQQKWTAPRLGFGIGRDTSVTIALKDIDAAGHLVDHGGERIGEGPGFLGMRLHELFAHGGGVAAQVEHFLAQVDRHIAFDAIVDNARHRGQAAPHQAAGRDAFVRPKFDDSETTVGIGGHAGTLLVCTHVSARPRWSWQPKPAGKPMAFETLFFIATGLPANSALIALFPAIRDLIFVWLWFRQAQSYSYPKARAAGLYDRVRALVR